VVVVARNEIRLQYSGFAIFAAKLVSVVTGLVFQTMISRATSKAEYGVWFNTSDVLAYFTLLMGVVPFWVMRYVARGKESSVKTGLLANLAISAVAFAGYLVFVPFIVASLGISQNYLPLYFVAALQIIEFYGINAFEACLQAFRPQTVGYGLLVQQVGKVVLGYFLIVRWGQPLFGAVVSVVVAFAAQLAYYYYVLADELRKHAHWGYVKDWLKGSVLNVYNVVGNQLAAFIFIMLLMYGTEAGRGIFGAAYQIANVIAYSSFLAFALYPKLLAERNHEDVTTALKMVMMFALPMTAGAVALADSYVSILNPSYRDAYIVLVVLAVDTLVSVVAGVFSSVLFGVENVDREEVSFKKLLKSKLFAAFSLPYVHSAIALPTAYYVLRVYAYNDPLKAALSVSVINAVARLVTFTILCSLVRGMIRVKIPWESLGKYALASAVMGALMYVLPHPSRTSLTLLMTAVGGAVYLALLMAMDKDARALPNVVFAEFFGKRKTAASP
jgi:hypothetical protein